MRAQYRKKVETTPRKNTREVIIEEKDGTPSPKEVPTIWRVNPSYTHANNTISIVRIILIIAMGTVFIIATYLLDLNLQISLIMGAVIMGGFVFVFYDYIDVVNNLFRKRIIIDPMENIISFWEENDQSTVFFTNKKDLIHNGVQIFRVEEIPENIHASINLFLKSLSEYKNMISFTYQIVQTPHVYLKRTDRSVIVKATEARYTNIYFCVNYAVKGILTQHKLSLLKQRMRYVGNVLRNNFTGSFHHFKITLLSGDNLLNALRTYFFKIPAQEDTLEYETKGRQTLSLKFFLKSIFICFLLIYLDYTLIPFAIPPLYIVLINLVMVALIIYLWWRQLFFVVRKRPFPKNRFALIDPFRGTVLFRFRGYSDTVFMHVENKLLIGIKMFNLAFSFPPAYSRSDKFIQAIMNKKVSFGYTCMNTPLSFAAFYKDGAKYLNQKTEDNLFNTRFRIQTKIEALNWLSMRSGMWQTILTMSVHEYELTDSINKLEITKIEEKLEEKAEVLRSAFNMNFFNFELIRLRRSKLISGVLCEILKTKDYSFYGSRLNYLLFQGKALQNLVEIVGELKKGIETRIAAEFNTPLHLENHITLGHTINTEVLEEELPFGFTEDQARRLLIVNGLLSSRELFAIKTVSELVKKKIPSLVFDFRGNWSVLIEHFKGTPHEKDFLHFKLGSAFTLNLLKSDIPYDKDNLEFLNYMYDAYSLAFRKHQKIVEMIRNTIMRNPNMDASSIKLDLINQNRWEKNPGSDALLALFSDFTEQDISYLQIAPPLQAKQEG